MMPRVSVVIPSYNHARYVSEAIGSVLNQTEADLELIVVDDGSTDQSLQIIHTFPDRRLRVIAQTNQGAAAAINRGLRESSGHYLAILNSDDVYDPQRLEKLSAKLEADPSVGLLGSHIEVVDSNGKSLGVKHGYLDLSPWPLEAPERSFRAGSDLRAALLTENYFATSSNFVFSRDWFTRTGEFRNLRYTHDWDFALRVAHITQVALLPEPLMQYRVHAANTIRENHAAMIFEICWCLAAHLPHSEAWQSSVSSVEAEYLDRLLHSIYTFNCDRILNVLLTMRIADNPTLALQLLERDNPCRTACMQYITQHSTRHQQGQRFTSIVTAAMRRFR